MLIALPIAAEKHPSRPFNALLDQSLRSRAHIGNRPVVAAGKIDLNTCLIACEAGTKAIENFCRSLPPDPEMRMACWSITLLSVPACKGFCYSWFLLD
jgi:hypothetical protein